MARRSLLTPALEERGVPQEEPQGASHEPQAFSARAAKPSRRDKLHIGGYYDPNDATIIAFQKLSIDLRRSQQDMLLEAIRDFVAKHQAERAFR
jgi:hypothetical protein